MEAAKALRFPAICLPFGEEKQRLVNDITVLFACFGPLKFFSDRLFLYFN